MIDLHIRDKGNTFLKSYPLISWRGFRHIYIAWIKPVIQSLKPPILVLIRSNNFFLFFFPFIPISRKSTVNDFIVLWKSGREQLSFKMALLMSDKKLRTLVKVDPPHFKRFFVQNFSTYTRVNTVLEIRSR